MLLGFRYLTIKTVQVNRSWGLALANRKQGLIPPSTQSCLERFSPFSHIFSAF